MMRMIKFRDEKDGNEDLIAGEGGGVDTIVYMTAEKLRFRFA